jgi:hypothetical protein
MATDARTEAPAVEIPTISQQEALKVLLQSLDERGLLQRPQELKEGDVPDGLNDEATFMYILVYVLGRWGLADKLLGDFFKAADLILRVLLTNTKKPYRSAKRHMPQKRMTPFP